MRQTLALCVIGAWIAIASPHASAQSPNVEWAVSAYGPGTTEAILGCGSCASDQRVMAVDAAGNVVVTGYATTTTPTTQTDMLTVKFNGATGAVLWQKTFNSAGDGFDQSWGMALDATGNAIVTGYAWTGTEYDIKTIKYASADGTVLWQNTFTGPSSGTDFGIVVGVDGAGNVFIGGNVWNGTNDDLKIIKLAASNGTVLWDKTFAGAAQFNDYAFALAVDAAGNVIVTGEHQKSGADSDWKTIKYASSDGTILWQADYAGPGAGLDIPYSVALDGAGNAVIAGNSHNGANFDAKVIKYSGANGAVLWDKSVAGTAGGDDMFYSVALDAAGNAIATGFTFNGLAGNDWKTVKFAAANGTLLWEKTFGGLGNMSDVSVAVAVDSEGNAIAGGRVNNSADPANRDMQVVKFAAADGAQIWAYTYAGSAGGFDRVAAVATRPGAVFLAGESLENGNPAGWRIVKLDDARLAAADFDLNGDGTSDLLLRNTDGSVYLWIMDTYPVSGNFLATDTNGWSVTHVADFDGDAKADILMKHTDGSVKSLKMNGSTVVSGALLLGVGTPWTVTHAGDVNGDGRADLILRHTDGSVYVWTMNGVPTGGGFLGTDTNGWVVTHVADFNGDGRADIVMKHTDGSVKSLQMDGAVITAGYLLLGSGAPWTVTHAGDVDGNGTADIALRHTDGSVYIWTMNGAPTGGNFLGTDTNGWVVTHMADFNGDGKSDIVMKHTDGSVKSLLMNGTTITNGYLLLGAGTPWTVTHTLDTTGDGKADILLRHTNQSVYLWVVDGLPIGGAYLLLGANPWTVVPPMP